MLATEEQVQAITGYKKASCQVQALTDDGVPCKLNARGKVVVFISALEARYGGENAEPAKQTTGPNLSWAEKESHAR